jgi:hypothetical protein
MSTRTSLVPSDLRSDRIEELGQGCKIGKELTMLQRVHIPVILILLVIFTILVASIIAPVSFKWRISNFFWVRMVFKFKHCFSWSKSFFRARFLWSLICQFKLYRCVSIAKIYYHFLEIYSRCRI